MTEINYLNDTKPSFQILPPAILSDTKFIPGFPSSFQKEILNGATKTKEEQEWFNLFTEKYAEMVVTQAFVRYFTKHSDKEGFLLHPYNSETFLGPWKTRAAARRVKEASIQSCQSSCLPLTDLELNISDCLGLAIRDILNETEGNDDIRILVKELKDNAKSKKENIEKSLKWAQKYDMGTKEIRNHVLYNISWMRSRQRILSRTLYLL